MARSAGNVEFSASRRLPPRIDVNLYTLVSSLGVLRFYVPDTVTVDVFVEGSFSTLHNALRAQLQSLGSGPSYFRTSVYYLSRLDSVGLPGALSPVNLVVNKQGQRGHMMPS